jgi:hypothetical protein
MRYYDLKKHWTKRIVPQLVIEELDDILVRDFNKFARWFCLPGICRTTATRVTGDWITGILSLAFGNMSVMERATG